MNDIERGVTAMKDVPTALDLRRQLHEIKFKSREDLAVAAQASPVTRFLQSNVFTALATSLGVFGVLYILNPPFVQENRERYTLARPSLKRVTAWAVLAGLLVLIAPLIYRRLL